MPERVEDDDIDVRYEVDPDEPLIGDGRPVLTWGCHAIHGNSWTLWQFENDEAVEVISIPGDLTDLDAALGSARKYLVNAPRAEEGVDAARRAPTTRALRRSVSGPGARRRQ